MSKKINHIGIAVKSIKNHELFYTDVIGLEKTGEEEVSSQKVKVAFFKAGESRIELLEPTSDDSPVAKFIEKRGEGMHHIAFTTDNIKERLDNLKEQGIRLIDETPREGAHNTKIAFIHPKVSRVLVELTEEE
ncbi:MAG: methylmalonyl-CoA epimerase [bacterium]